MKNTKSGAFVKIGCLSYGQRFLGLAMGVAVLVAFSGLIDVQPQRANAVDHVEQNFIELDAPNSVRKVSLYSHFEMDAVFAKGVGWAPSVEGSNREYLPALVDLDAATALSPIRRDSTEPTGQSFGGTGTGEDPYFVQSSRPLAGEGSAIQFTNRQSVVLGLPYYRTDLTIKNNDTKTRHIQYGSYAQCRAPAGGTVRSTIEKDRLVKCYGLDFETSFIPITAGAAFTAGNNVGAKSAAYKPLVNTDSADACWVSGTAQGDCTSSAGGQSMAVVWRAELLPGQSATSSYLTAMVDNLKFAHLTPTSSVSPAAVGIGENATFSLSMKNEGPDSATNNVLSFEVPEGMTFVGANGPGTYDAVKGAWTVPSIAAGDTVTLDVLAKSENSGEYSSRITNVSTESIDMTPCTVDGACGGNLTVKVADVGAADQSVISADPIRVDLGKATTSTITVTAKKADGTAAEAGATVVISPSLGQLVADETGKTVTDNGDGTYTATLRSTVAGTSRVSFSLGGHAGGSTSVTYAPGAVSVVEGNSGIEVSQGARPVTEGHTIRARLADRFGNPLSLPALERESKLKAVTNDSLGAGEIGEFSESVDVPGTYEATITSSEIGKKKISVDAMGERLPVLPNAADIAEFVPGPVDLSRESRTEFSVSEKEKLVGDETHTVTVKLADGNGNPVRGLAVKLLGATKASLGEGRVSSFTESETQAGTYTAVVSSTKPGEKQISVTLADAGEIRASGNDTARFKVGSIDPARADTNFTVTAGPQPVVGGSHRITVELNDRFGNLITAAAPRLTATTKVHPVAGQLGTGTITGFVEDLPDSPGVYFATVTSSLAGAKEMKVTHGSAGDISVKAKGGNATALFTRKSSPPTDPVMDFSNGKVVTGGVIDPEDTLDFRFANGRQVPGTLVIDSSGRFTFQPEKPLGSEDVVQAIVTDPDGDTASARVNVKSTPPSAPTVEKVRTTDVVGTAEPGATVEVRDGTGQVIGTGVAGPDGRYRVVFTEVQEPGAKITATATDLVNNVSDEATGFVVKPLVLLVHSPILHEDDEQVAYGYGFSPGEKISGVLDSDSLALGSWAADDEGEIVLSFSLPKNLAWGDHVVTLNGESSGSVEAQFSLQQFNGPRLVTTGTDTELLWWCGLMALGLGAGLLSVRRRRSLAVSSVRSLGPTRGQVRR